MKMLNVVPAVALFLTSPLAHPSREDDEDPLDLNCELTFLDLFERIDRELPKDLTRTEQTIVVTLLNFDTSGFPFIKELCETFNGRMRLEYLVRLVERGIIGHRLALFGAAFQQNLRTGYHKLLLDRAALDKILFPAPDPSTRH